MPDTTTQPPREEVIGHYWPYDGPHETDSIASALEAVADLVRTTANATRSPSAVGTGPDGYRVLGGLTIAGRSAAAAAVTAGHVGRTRRRGRERAP